LLTKNIYTFQIIKILDYKYYGNSTNTEKCRKKIKSFDRFTYLIRINQDQVDIMLNYRIHFHQRYSFNCAVR